MEGPQKKQQSVHLPDVQSKTYSSKKVIPSLCIAYGYLWVYSLYINPMANNAKIYPDEECICPLMDRQTLNAGAGSWTTSMDWHCKIHGKQHRDYEKPEGWGGDWTPQQQLKWSQSIKHAMNKQNEHKVEPRLEFKVGPPPIHEHYNEKTDRAELCGRVVCPEGFIGISLGSASDAEKLPNPEDDDPNAAGNRMPATGVSWEAELRDIHSDIRVLLHGALIDKNIKTIGQCVDKLVPYLIEFIHKQIDLAREESKHVTKSGRVMYMRGYDEGKKEVRLKNGTLQTAYELGFDTGRKEALAEFMEIAKKMKHITTTNSKARSLSGFWALYWALIDTRYGKN